MSSARSCALPCSGSSPCGTAATPSRHLRRSRTEAQAAVRSRSLPREAETRRLLSSIGMADPGLSQHRRKRRPFAAKPSRTARCGKLLVSDGPAREDAMTEATSAGFYEQQRALRRRLAVPEAELLRLAGPEDARGLGWH